LRLRRRSFGLLALMSALPLRSFAKAEASEAPVATVLTAVAYELFPHESVALSRYQGLADTFISTDPVDASGLVALLGGKAFLELSRLERQGRMRSTADDTRFRALRLHVLVGLYGDLEVTRRFGYQGPSLEAGGYIERGFDDIRWLPEPHTNEV